MVILCGYAKTRRRIGWDRHLILFPENSDGSFVRKDAKTQRREVNDRCPVALMSGVWRGTWFRRKSSRSLSAEQLFHCHYSLHTAAVHVLLQPKCCHQGHLHVSLATFPLGQCRQFPKSASNRWKASNQSLMGDTSLLPYLRREAANSFSCTRNNSSPSLSRSLSSIGDTAVCLNTKRSSKYSLTRKVFPVLRRPYTASI